MFDKEARQVTQSPVRSFRTIKLDLGRRHGTKMRSSSKPRGQDVKKALFLPMKHTNNYFSRDIRISQLHQGSLGANDFLVKRIQLNTHLEERSALSKDDWAASSHRLFGSNYQGEESQTKGSVTERRMEPSTREGTVYTKRELSAERRIAKKASVIKVSDLKSANEQLANVQTEGKAKIIRGNSKKETGMSTNIQRKPQIRINIKKFNFQRKKRELQPLKTLEVYKELFHKQVQDFLYQLYKEVRIFKKRLGGEIHMLHHNWEEFERDLMRRSNLMKSQVLRVAKVSNQYSGNAMENHLDKEYSVDQEEEEVKDTLKPNKHFELNNHLDALNNQSDQFLFEVLADSLMYFRDVHYSHPTFASLQELLDLRKMGVSFLLSPIRCLSGFTDKRYGWILADEISPKTTYEVMTKSKKEGACWVSDQIENAIEEESLTFLLWGFDIKKVFTKTILKIETPSVKMNFCSLNENNITNLIFSQPKDLERQMIGLASTVQFESKIISTTHLMSCIENQENLAKKIEASKEENYRFYKHKNRESLKEFDIWTRFFQLRQVTPVALPEQYKVQKERARVEATAQPPSNTLMVQDFLKSVHITGSCIQHLLNVPNTDRRSSKSSLSQKSSEDLENPKTGKSKSPKHLDNNVLQKLRAVKNMVSEYNLGLHDFSTGEECLNA